MSVCGPSVRRLPSSGAATHELGTRLDGADGVGDGGARGEGVALAALPLERPATALAAEAVGGDACDQQLRGGPASLAGRQREEPALVDQQHARLGHRAPRSRAVRLAADASRIAHRRHGRVKQRTARGGGGSVASGWRRGGGAAQQAAGDLDTQHAPHRVVHTLGRHVAPPHRRLELLELPPPRQVAKKPEGRVVDVSGGTPGQRAWRESGGAQRERGREGHVSDVSRARPPS